MILLRCVWYVIVFQWNKRTFNWSVRVLISFIYRIKYFDKISNMNTCFTQPQTVSSSRNLGQNFSPLPFPTPPGHRARALSGHHSPPSPSHILRRSPPPPPSRRLRAGKDTQTADSGGEGGGTCVYRAAGPTWPAASSWLAGPNTVKP